MLALRPLASRHDPLPTSSAYQTRSMIAALTCDPHVHASDTVMPSDTSNSACSDSTEFG